MPEQEQYADNGFPCPMPELGGAPPSAVIEAVNPFDEGVTPAVDTASEPWFENIAQAEENEPGEGSVIAEDE